MSWKRMLARSSALDASERSIASIVPSQAPKRADMRVSDVCSHGSPVVSRASACSSADDAGGCRLVSSIVTPLRNTTITISSTRRASRLTAYWPFVAHASTRSEILMRR